MTLEEYKKKYPDDIPDGFTEKDYEQMLEFNPYRPSRWWHPTPHEGWNNRYINGWVHGKYAGFNRILDWIKENKQTGWTINREELRQMFADITNHPDFGLKKEEKS